MRIFVPAILVLALGACDPAVPNSGAGVGFDGYTSYERQRAAREAKLQGETAPAAGTISQETVAPAQQTPPLTATTTPVKTNNVGISDEQDFGAVSERESIASDKERLARQREQYVQIAPKAVPTGNGGGAARVVQFALSTTNAVGESIYRRSIVFAKSRFEKNCAKYPSPDMAQTAFLQSGGPQKDRNGLDPDGDGFACSWNPQPFRNARSGG
ncbi:hypothetical protein [Profundibacter sp.]